MNDTILNKLKTIRSNFPIGLFSFCLIRRLKPEDLLTVNRVIVGEDGLYCIPPNQRIPEDAGDFYEADQKMLSTKKKMNLSNTSLTGKENREWGQLEKREMKSNGRDTLR